MLMVLLSGLVVGQYYDLLFLSFPPLLLPPAQQDARLMLVDTVGASLLKLKGLLQSQSEVKLKGEEEEGMMEV